MTYDDVRIAISPLGQVGVRNPSIHHSDSDRCADSNGGNRYHYWVGQVLFYTVMVSDLTWYHP
ncbi:hypothetical protein PROFUN_07331 [Planoprotostelium fungivorum]|uniref:Uncharacterized protein n=1 Tax=Planoprotostelium fungivorum TaxID=1890364 RepID=A0A2P6NLV1_9EUKA|nr:hypothetical protein PROFUN_07331 [Planoprotostelium fungivorum]